MEVEGHGKRPPQSVLVEVTAAEVALCHEFAVRCSRLRGYSGNGGWRGGLVGAMRMFGGASVAGAEAGIVVGKVGELALCKYFGVSIDLALKDRGDGGKDLPLPAGSVQVKTSTKPYLTKLVRSPCEECDWFAFATWCGTTPQVIVDGYIHRSSVIRIPPTPARRGHWMNHEVPVSCLLPISSLARIRPIREVL